MNRDRHLSEPLQPDDAENYLKEFTDCAQLEAMLTILNLTASQIENIKLYAEGKLMKFKEDDGEKEEEPASSSQHLQKTTELPLSNCMVTEDVIDHSEDSQHSEDSEDSEDEEGDVVALNENENNILLKMAAENTAEHRVAFKSDPSSKKGLNISATEFPAPSLPAIQEESPVAAISSADLQPLQQPHSAPLCTPQSPVQPPAQPEIQIAAPAQPAAQSPAEYKHCAAVLTTASVPIQGGYLSYPLPVPLSHAMSNSAPQCVQGQSQSVLVAQPMMSIISPMSPLPAISPISSVPVPFQSYLPCSPWLPSSNPMVIANPSNLPHSLPNPLINMSQKPILPVFNAKICMLSAENAENFVKVCSENVSADNLSHRLFAGLNASNSSYHCIPPRSDKECRPQHIVITGTNLHFAKEQRESIYLVSIPSIWNLDKQSALWQTALPSPYQMRWNAVQFVSRHDILQKYGIMFSKLPRMPSSAASTNNDEIIGEETDSASSYSSRSRGRRPRSPTDRTLFRPKHNNHAKGNFYISKEFVSLMLKMSVERFDTNIVNDEKLVFGHYKESVAMQINDRQIFVYSTEHGKIVLINIDLHFVKSNIFGKNMYLVGTPNDADHRQKVEWKITEFLTEEEILAKYGINSLPQSSRQQNWYKKDINNPPGSINWSRVQIPYKIPKKTSKRKGGDKKIMSKRISMSSLKRQLRDALERFGYDASSPTVPVVVIKGNRQWIEWKKFGTIKVEDGSMVNIGMSLRYHSDNNLWRMECIELCPGRIYYQHRLAALPSDHPLSYSYHELPPFINIDDLDIY